MKVNVDESKTTLNNDIDHIKTNEITKQNTLRLPPAKMPLTIDDILSPTSQTSDGTIFEDTLIKNEI